MVKISFQPAVAGIKGDKADKALASAAAAAPAPGPAAEILLTPARVRGAGDSGGGPSTPHRPQGLPRRIGAAELGWESGMVIHPKLERGSGPKAAAEVRSVPKCGRWGI